ncbi:MAG: cytochrome c biogenesis protein CcdA [Bacteroidales bacterium]|nr:cytochrome c biogenesis protein CcdA [Bacteroidales bacterium]
MKRFFLTVCSICMALLAFAQETPIKWQFTQQTIDEQTVEVQMNATIDNGWHLYTMDVVEDGPVPLEFTFENLKNAKPIGKVQAKSTSHEMFDNMFEATVRFYEKSAKFVQRFQVSGDYEINGYLRGQGCNDQACMPVKAEIRLKGTAKSKTPVAVTPENETTEELAETTATDSVDTTVAENVSEVSENDLYRPVIEELKAYENDGSTEKKRSLLYVFLMGILGGLVALVTPCVWPIIPMTVSFFLKRSGDKRKGRRDAMLYGISIIVIYLSLGLIITAIFGPSALNGLATNAVFNIIFFLLLVVFAISFFGAFELTLPASWSNKMDEKAESTTGFLSILFMAFTLVLVSFSCTGPIIGTLLVEVATTGEWLAPAIGMLGFALALAIPFSLFAFFPTMLQNMPKSGGWLNTVKVVLGFLELALSLKFLSVADLAYGWHILDREVFVSLWIVIFTMLGLYLLGKIRFPHDDEVQTVSVTRFSLALISIAFAVYMIPGLWGAPLKAISAFAPPLNTQDFNLYENEVHPDYTDYELGMAAARQSGKPVVIDFSGYGCVNCRKMEAAVWTDNTVADILNDDVILISLMVDDKTPLPKPIEVSDNGQVYVLRTIGDKNSYLQSHKFGANAQPFYVMVDAEGNPINKSQAFNEDPSVFIEYLNDGIDNFKIKE